MSKRYAKYKTKDGKILKDGHTMLLADVIKGLERKSYLERMYDKLKELHFKFEEFDYEQINDILSDAIGVDK